MNQHPDSRTGGEEIGKDALFDTLAARNRRTVIAYFLDADEDTATVGDLVRQCQRVDDGDHTVESTHRVKARLLHVHLPKLADAGVVEFDLQDQTVDYRGNAALEKLVEGVQDSDSKPNTGSSYQ